MKVFGCCFLVFVFSASHYVLHSYLETIFVNNSKYFSKIHLLPQRFDRVTKSNRKWRTDPRRTERYMHLADWGDVLKRNHKHKFLSQTTKAMGMKKIPFSVFELTFSCIHELTFFFSQNCEKQGRRRYRPTNGC